MAKTLLKKIFFSLTAKENHATFIAIWIWSILWKQNNNTPPPPTTTPHPPQKKNQPQNPNPKALFGFEEMDKHMLLNICKTTWQVYLKLLNLAFYTYKRPKMTTSDSRLFIYF